MIIDGRAIAEDILKNVKSQITQLSRMSGAMMPSMPTVRAITVGPNAVTESYLKIKTNRAQDAGMLLQVVRLPETATEEEVITEVERSGANAIIVQLPLPAHLNEEHILSRIPLKMDADVLSLGARTRFSNSPAGSGALIPPVASAVAEVLFRSNVLLEGKRVVVIGEGKLVGAPVATYLKNRGANVTTYNVHTFEPSTLKDAEIIISGAGNPHLITPDMISEGVVLIDAGTSEQGGEIKGDIDPACAELASVYTPVPGGIGPITVACLFRNVLRLLENS